MISWLFFIETVFGLGLSMWIEALLENAWPCKLDTEAARHSFAAAIKY